MSVTYGYALCALFAASALHADWTADVEQKLVAKDYKAAIQLCRQELVKSPKSPAVKLKLASALYHDQEHSLAFDAFLEAIDLNAKRVSNLPCAEDQRLYAEALPLYLDHSKGPQETAIAIRDRYAPLVKEHPDYYLLGYIVAVAYANLGAFDQFFDIFYRSFTANPDHYITYKAKAVLHIRLHGFAKEGDEREKQRECIITNVSKAMEMYPQDVSLYKLLLLFSNEKTKKTHVEKALGTMMTQNVMVARSDIAFYVQQAVAVQEWQLAQDFIDKAKEHYAVSRVIQSAQEYLDKHRK